MRRCIPLGLVAVNLLKPCGLFQFQLSELGGLGATTGALKVIWLLHRPFSEALGGNEVPGLLWLVAPLAVALGVLGRCKVAWHSYAHRVVYGAPLAVAALVDRKLVNSGWLEGKGLHAP